MVFDGGVLSHRKNHILNGRVSILKNDDMNHINTQIMVDMSDSHSKLSFHTQKEGGLCDSHQIESYRKWQYEAF